MVKPNLKERRNPFSSWYPFYPLFHPLLDLRVVGVFEPTIRIGDLDAVKSFDDLMDWSLRISHFLVISEKEAGGN